MLESLHRPEDDDGEAWQPGEQRMIPRISGRGYLCTITAVTPSEVHFTGPTGAASITRALLRSLNAAQPTEEIRGS